MPVIFVYGIPSSVTDPGNFVQRRSLMLLMDQIKREVSGTVEFNISYNDVTVFFPTDLVQEGLGEEVMVFVRGLFDKPQRTAHVRCRLAEAIVDCCTGILAPVLMNLAKVECFIEPYNPMGGFASKTIPVAGR